MPRISISSAVLALFLTALMSAAQTGPMTSTEVIERVSPSVALVLCGKSPTTMDGLGSAIVVRENGILLTAYHVIKDAKALQIRFKNGETFDDVQLLGVDVRRDVAAIRITASGLKVLPIASAEKSKSGDPVFVVSNAAGLPWSASSGIVSAYRLADEVPGAGSGYRLLQFTAPASGGSSGGLVVDAQARVLALIVGGITGGENLNFGVPIENVLGLAESPVRQTFASGAALQLPSSSQAVSSSAGPKPAALPPPTAVQAVVVGSEPEIPKGELAADLARSELLKSKDPDFILRHFRTMYVDAREAKFFDSDRMKAALGSNKEFNSLHISMVDDRRLADVVLEVNYTFAWDYPFSLKHQVTSLVLVSGKGYGAFSGPAGAESVASRLIKALKPYRTEAAQPKKAKAKAGE